MDGMVNQARDGERAVRVDARLARVARRIVDGLWSVGEAYHAGAIEAPIWKARNRALWAEAEEAEVETLVKTMLRTDVA